MNIGKNIKYLRQRMNLTQEQTAERLGVSYQAVSKWETGANTPDIALLPEIAGLFCTTIDALFSENIDEIPADFPIAGIADDGIIRIIQLKGRKIIKLGERMSQDNPPFEIAFPRDCNDRTQYFRVEVYGHIISDSSINGDVVCHGSLSCGTINGDVTSSGDIKVSEINSSGKITCGSIRDCYKIECREIECSGDVKCGEIVYRE